MTQCPGHMNWLPVWSKMNMSEHFKSCFIEISSLLLVIRTCIGFSLNYIRYQMASWTICITVFFVEKPVIRHAIRQRQTDILVLPVSIACNSQI